MSFITIDPQSDFSYENLPYGVFSLDQNGPRHIGVAIGESVLDLSKIKHLFNGELMQQQQVGLITTILMTLASLFSSNDLACLGSIYLK